VCIQISRRELFAIVYTYTSAVYYVHDIVRDIKLTTNHRIMESRLRMIRRSPNYNKCYR
jgi:hypothetical protein